MFKKILKASLIASCLLALPACSPTTEEPIKKEKKEISSIDTVTLSQKAMDFSSENITDVFNYSFNKDKNKSFVYSPYSHLSCVNLLNKYMKVPEKNYLSAYKDCDFSLLELNNIKSANLLIVKKKSNKEIDFGEVQFADFPSEAEKKAKDLQKTILGEVLLEPKYDDPAIETVGINATKFFGLWSEAFDKSAAIKNKYTLVNGKIIEVDKMYSGDFAEDSPYAYEDDKVKMYKKPILKEGGDKEVTSYAYMIMPKQISGVEEVGQNIVKYIKDFQGKADKYDEVYISMPKLDIKSELDLYDIAKNSNKNYVNDLYRFNGEFRYRNNDDMKISDLKQIATLEVDESKVEAKAITEMVTEAMMAPPQENKVFEMDINKPFFFVVVSNSHVEEAEPVITFMSYINNPIEK